MDRGRRTRRQLPWAVGVPVLTGALSLLSGCAASTDVGSIEAIKGSFLSEAQVGRVADLMARDLVREPLLYGGEEPPRIAMVKVENDTCQYFFAPARKTYITRMRALLLRALGERVAFVDPETEEKLRAELAHWYIDEPATVELARGHSDRYGVDYLLTARFLSQDKVVDVPQKKGPPLSRRVVVLQMNFSLVDADSAEIAWMNSVSSAAAFSTRDFQD